ARRAVWGQRQRPSHADAVLDRVAEPLVESDDVAVLALDLQVDLRAAELQQPPLGLAHEGAADPAALVLGCDRDTVEPAAMAVVPRGGGADAPVPGRGAQEELARAPAPASDDLPGRPPARVVVEHAPPERSHRRGVGVAELADDDVSHQRSLPATASAAASP